MGKVLDLAKVIDDDDENTITFGTLEDLKRSFLGWIDTTFNIEGEKRTGYKIDEDGKLTLRVYDTFVSSSNGDGGKTYQIVIENYEEQEVLN